MHFKDQFIVYLHDHPHARFLFAASINGNHRALDNVRRGPLHRGVDRRTFCAGATRALLDLMSGR
jgi:hypothetical protein